MAVLKKSLHYLPEVLVLIFLITILWVLFLPHFESPFRVKLNVAQAKQIFFLSLLASVFLFFANYFLPKYLSLAKYKVHLIVSLNIAFTVGYFLLILSILGLPYDKISHRFGVVAQPLWSLFFCGYSAVLGFLLYFYKNSLAEKDALQKREKELQEINLSALKNLLNPHFLFNILNNIDAEIMLNPASASDMLIRLSKLMRYVIYEDKLVSLAKEIGFVEEYIELQTTRNQAKIICHFETDIANENAPIAPAIFLPYIENAFKYCDLSNKTNSITLLLKQGSNNILFVITNPIASVVSSHIQVGKGLEIAEKRLQMFYPNNYSILIENKEHIYKVKIVIWEKSPA